jgi:hypothetical protein
LTDKDKNILAKYLPEGAVEPVASIIEKYKIHFKITKRRNTKLGDYRPPIIATNHRISINHDLNPYSFLITFIHETAHLLVYEKYKNNISSPHGIEWKTEYKNLMNLFLSFNIFPEELSVLIRKSIINSKASTINEIELNRALKKYDDKMISEGIVNLEDLPDGKIFITQNGHLFKKGDKRRIRYRCFNLRNKQWYLFHPLTPVLPKEND